MFWRIFSGPTRSAKPASASRAARYGIAATYEHRPAAPPQLFREFFQSGNRSSIDRRHVPQPYDDDGGKRSILSVIPAILYCRSTCLRA